MRELSVLLEQYLQTRRAAGAKLKDPEWLLRQFLSFLAQRQVTVITTDLAQVCQATKSSYIYQ